MHNRIGRINSPVEIYQTGEIFHPVTPKPQIRKIFLLIDSFYPFHASLQADDTGRKRFSQAFHLRFHLNCLFYGVAIETISSSAMIEYILKEAFHNSSDLNGWEKFR